MIPEHHNLHNPNPGIDNEKKDLKVIKHGRDKLSGFLIGKSSFPCFFSADGHNVHIQDSARGRSVMIIMHDSELISNKIHETTTWNLNCDFGVPNFLTFTDLDKINGKILSNTKTMKILPYEFCDHISHNPFCFYYIRNNFLNNEFLSEETINNSNIYITILKLAYIIGFRYICFNGTINDPQFIYDYFKTAISYGIEISVTRKNQILDEFYIEIDEAYEKCISYK